MTTLLGTAWRSYMSNACENQIGRGVKLNGGALRPGHRAGWLNARSVIRKVINAAAERLVSFGIRYRPDITHVMPDSATDPDGGIDDIFGPVWRGISSVKCASTSSHFHFV